MTPPCQWWYRDGWISFIDHGALNYKLQKTPTDFRRDDIIERYGMHINYDIIFKKLENRKIFLIYHNIHSTMFSNHDKYQMTIIFMILSNPSINFWTVEWCKNQIWQKKKKAWLCNNVKNSLLYRLLEFILKSYWYLLIYYRVHKINNDFYEWFNY